MGLRSEQGASAVEFALIAPLLLVLTFGIIEFGLLLFDKAVITNASREGARAGVVFSKDAEGNPISVSDVDIRAAVKDYVFSKEGSDILINLGPSGIQNLTDADIKIEPAEVDRSTGVDLRVTVTFAYDFLIFPDLTTLLGEGSFDGTIPLTGETVMRME